MKPKQIDDPLESGAEYSELGGFCFHCPVCNSSRQLEFTPRPGYLVLCGNCLVVLVTERTRPKAKPVPEFRRLQDTDFPQMDQEQYGAIVEAKNRRLRARLLAKWAFEVENRE